MSLLFFSLRHPWPICSLWASSSLFTNSAFPWTITNFIGLPWPNYFIPILRVHGLAINPLLSLFALLLGLQWPVLTFLHHILPMGMLFLSFRASLSPFTSSRPIFLFHELMIHHSCCLGLMVFSLICQTFATLVARLSAFHLDPQKWPSTFSPLNIWSIPTVHMWMKDLSVFPTYLLSFPSQSFWTVDPYIYIYIYIYFFFFFSFPTVNSVVPSNFTI